MNCRLFAVIAVGLSGLVPAIQPASAGHPTHQRATATATILSPVTIRDVLGGKAGGATGSSRRLHSANERYVDDNGFVTNDRNARRYPIRIIDLP